jgi:ribosome-binding protein aMBF1 (putative translation factor)
MPHVNRQHKCPDDPADVDSLDRPGWFKERIRLMQQRADGGCKSVFGDGRVCEVTGMPAHEIAGVRNGKEAKGELAESGGGQKVDQSFTFAEILKKMRTLRRLSVRELARLLGIRHATILYWERGLHEPSVSDVRQLARALHTSVAVLVGEKAPPAA